MRLPEDSNGCQEPHQGPSDEIVLIQRAREGDSESFNTVYGLYKPRIYSFTHRYFAPGADPEDLIQEAAIGFFKAVRDFNGERGAFGAFVELCVRRQVISFIKGATRKKHLALNRAVSLDAPLSDDSSETLLSHIAALGQPDASYDHYDIDFVNELWKRCSALERDVFSLYPKGYRVQEIAQELAVRSKVVDNAIWRVKVKANKLRAKSTHR